MNSATTSEDKSFLWDRKSLRPDVWIKMPDKSREKMKGPEAYASFGKNGTTASVNAFGHIMQISKFASYGSSGFVCADANYDDPYYVTDRIESLMEAATGPENGLRLDLVEWRQFHDVPSLGYMYDQWPRYTYRQKPIGGVKNPDQRTDTTKAFRTTPRTQAKSEVENFPLSIQYFCCNGTIVQKYLINLGEEGLSHDQIKWGDHPLAPNLCIRDLDFVNQQSFTKQYTSVISESTLVISQSICTPAAAVNSKTQSMLGTGLTPVLFISPFINGRAAKVVEGNCVKLDYSPGLTRLEISVAYTLKVLPQAAIEDLIFLSNLTQTLQPRQAESYRRSVQANGEVEDDQMVAGTSNNPPSDEEVLDEDSLLKPIFEVKEVMREMDSVFQESSKFRRIYFSQDDSLDLVYRRHLEHLLSVCCIPVSTSSSDGEVAIAITCGDISGHRIGPRASLSAIQFLIAMLTYLDPNNESSAALRSRNKAMNVESERRFSDEKEIKAQTGSEQTAETHNSSDPKNDMELEAKYTCDLHRRVKDALEGHMRWICTETESSPNDPKGAFATHYWPSGSAIRDLDYLSPASLIDTPIQLIKVLLYLKTFGDNEPPDWMCDGLEEKAGYWLNSLHSLNGRATYAFSRRFRTTDARYTGHEEIPESESKFSLTDHVMIGLAVSCIDKIWPLQENQPEIPTDQVPQRLHLGQLQCYYTYKEVQHKILKRFTTENPMTKQRTLSTSRWSDKTRFLLHSKDTFLFSAVHEGFFKKSSKSEGDREKNIPNFDPFAKAWRRVDERWTRLLEVQSYHEEFQQLNWSDPLWCAMAFALSCKGYRVNHQPSQVLATEIRSVIMKAASFNGIFPGLLDSNRMSTMFDVDLSRDNYWFATFELPYMLWTFDNLGSFDVKPVDGSSTPPTQSGLQSVNKDVRGTGQHIDKHVPFDTLTFTKDGTSLVLLSDDWLLDPPEYTLSFGEKIGLNDKTNHRPIFGNVIDISRYSLGTEILMPLSNNSNTLNRIFEQRSRWLSKKQIVWLPDCNKSTAEFISSTFSNTDERLSSFINRHSNQVIQFFDISTAALNKWETELHFSFFRMTPDKKNCFCLLGDSLHLRSATISFRFSGDFADRSWTCYLLEDGTGVESETNLASHLFPDKLSAIDFGIKPDKEHENHNLAEKASLRRRYKYPFTRPWQQRRVLELVMYSKMLDIMCKHSEGIFQEVRSLALSLNEDDDAGAQRDPFFGGIQEAEKLRKMAREDQYFDIASRWREIVPILDVFKDNLSHNLDIVKEWHRREKNRGSQQPRWTKADKQNYSSAISRLEGVTASQTRDIEHLQDRIKKFSESLPSQLASIRDDLNFRGSQSINLFTYVTIVFLPLGFATGLLSMNGLPDPSLLPSLYSLAFGALGITIFALLNAKTAKALVTPLADGYHAIIARWGRSMLRWSWPMWQLLKFAFLYLVAMPILRFHAQLKIRVEKLKTKSNIKTDPVPKKQGPAPAPFYWSWYEKIIDFEFQETMESERKTMRSEMDKQGTVPGKHNTESLSPESQRGHEEV